MILKSVVLVLEVTDMEKLGAIMNDPNVQEAKDRHTVVDPILLSMQVEGLTKWTYNMQHLCLIIPKELENFQGFFYIRPYTNKVKRQLTNGFAKLGRTEIFSASFHYFLQLSAGPITNPLRHFCYALSAAGWLCGFNKIAVL